MLSAFRIPRARFLALAIVACALMARILVPQGWMPVRTAEGWRITICTGMGPMPTVLHGAKGRAMSGMHHGSESQGHGPSDHPCAFSGLSMALDTPPLPVVSPAERTIEPWLAVFAAASGIGRGLAAPPPPATGPPLLL